MRMLLLIAFITACGSGSSGSEFSETGECDPPADGTDVAVTPLQLFDTCDLTTLAEINLVESEAQWNALFSCAQPVPEGLDLRVERAAVVHVSCSQTEYRFTADRPAEVVIGIFSRVTGACIANVVVVPLARSSKPARLARCQETCSGECPPVG